MTESDNDIIRATDKERVAPRAVGKYLAQIGIVFAVQFAAGKLSETLPTINSGGIGPVWPASGIALAALLLCGYRVWPGVAAGAFLLTFLSHIPHVAAFVYATGTTLAALTAAFLLRRLAKFDSSLSRLRDALGLIVFGGLGSSTVSASIGVSVLYAAHLHGWSGFGSAWLIYWLGDSMGVVLMTPLALTFPNLLRIRPWVRIAELAALLLLLTMVCFIIFSDGLFAVRLHILAFAVFPFVVWAAVRFGVSGTALSNVFIAGIAAVETASGSGPFAQSTPFMNAVLLDLFFGVLSVSGLMLATVIAERERAESEREQLIGEQAASEARLRLATIVESSDDAIIGKDIDGIVMDWNNGAERLYGYSAGEVIGKPVSFLIPPDCSDDFPKIMETLRQGNTVKDYQTVRQRKDGTRIEISLTMSPIRDTEGRIVGSSAIARDIRERKRAEESLRESEERLRLAAQAGRMYAFDFDVATDAIVRSGECAHILGWTDHPAHDTNRQFLTRVHPDDREQYVAIEARLNPENATYQTSYRLLRPDDGVVWLEESGRAVFDEQGRMLRMIGMVADVTDRKLAEERLREYEKAVEGSEEMIAVVDREYRYLIANRKFLNYRSMTKEQVVGRLVPEVLSKGVFETAVKEKLDECFQGKVVRYEMRYTYPELGERDVFVSYFPIEGVGGVDRVACIVQDITERKLAEVALSGVSRRLIAAQEQERTRIARELHDDIAQRLALLTIELEHFQRIPPNSAVEISSRVNEVRKQIIEISTDVQALSHELHSSKLEYLGIVAAMRSFCREFGERQKVEIDFEGHDLPAPLPGEVSLCLFRVLQEALHNAAKYSGVGHVKVQLWGTSSEVHLKVSDLGRGFDTKAALKGRGLGLTSMKERLHLVKGEISIDSAPNSGTTIHVRVPLSSESDSMRAAG